MPCSLLTKVWWHFRNVMTILLTKSEQGLSWKFAAHSLLTFELSNVENCIWARVVSERRLLNLPLIPKESRFWFLGHFWHFFWNWFRNCGQKNRQKNRKRIHNSRFLGKSTRIAIHNSLFWGIDTAPSRTLVWLTWILMFHCLPNAGGGQSANACLAG